MRDADYIIVNDGSREYCAVIGNGVEHSISGPDYEFLDAAKRLASHWKELTARVSAFLNHCDRCNMITREEETMVAEIRQVMGTA